MKRVTGIGGIFFKCNNPEQTKQWYREHLGINSDEYGSKFLWRDTNDRNKKGSTIWGPFSNDTDYFDPGGKEFMINYRVENLKLLIEELRKEGVEVLGSVVEYDYGKFAWIRDPDGNKVELWEPVDEKLSGTVATD